MERSKLDEMAMVYISDLVDQLVKHQANGDEVNMAIIHSEIKSLTSALDSDDATDNIFWARYYGNLI